MLTVRPSPLREGLSDLGPTGARAPQGPRRGECSLLYKRHHRRAATQFSVGLWVSSWPLVAEYIAKGCLLLDRRAGFPWNKTLPTPHLLFSWRWRESGKQDIGLDTDPSFSTASKKPPLPAGLWLG